MTTGITTGSVKRSALESKGSFGMVFGLVLAVGVLVAGGNFILNYRSGPSLEQEIYKKTQATIEAFTAGVTATAVALAAVPTETPTPAATPIATLTQVPVLREDGVQLWIMPSGESFAGTAEQFQRAVLAFGSIQQVAPATLPAPTSAPVVVTEIQVITPTPVVVPLGFVLVCVHGEGLTGIYLEGDRQTWGLVGGQCQAVPVGGVVNEYKLTVTR